MLTHNPVRVAVRRSLVMSVAASAALLGNVSALAQDQDTSGELTEVIVTGSRIVRQDFIANSPITTISAEQLAQNADITLDTYLNTLPGVNPAGTTTSNNPGNGGQSNIDLRGLGANRNLVLVDGRRPMVSASDQTVDLNTIPSALIESIEVITGGAGAAYGADAIAGAVNLKLKRNFEGAELSAGVTDSTEYSDAQEYTVSAAFGANFADDRGNAIIGFEYGNREGMIKSQRPFSANATATTSFNPEGVYFPTGNNPTQAAVDGVFAGYGVAAGAVPASGTLIGFNLDGTLFSRGVFNSPLDVQNWRYPVDLAINSALFPDTYSYNFDAVNILVLPLERRSMMTKFNYEWDNGVEVFSQFGYTQYTSAAALAPTPIPTITTAAPGEARSAGEATSALVAPGGRLTAVMPIPVTNPFIPADFHTLLASRTGDNPSLVGSGATEPFLMRQRTLDAGLRQSNYQNTVVQYLLGVKGKFNDSWRWEAYASEGRTEIAEQQTGNIDTQRLLALLEAPDGGASLCAGGFNPFGRQPISEECTTYLEVNNTLTTKFKQQILQAYVSGDVTELPAGPLSVVLGAEYRGFRYAFDPGSAGGPISGFNVQNPAGGTNAFKDLFGEALIPLVRDAAWAKSLELSLGYRLSDSEFKDTANGVATDGSSDSAYKVELSWAPSDLLRLRASYQRAVRAPNFGELFDGGGSNPQYFDPCSVTSAARTSGANAAQLRALCRDAGQIGGLGAAVDTYVQTPGTQLSTTLTANTSAKPETADTITFGVVFTEPFGVQRLRASLDYYNIKLKDPLISPDSNLFVADCYNYYGNNPTYDPNHPNCAGIFRAGDILGIDNLDDPNGYFPYVNGGEYKTDGIDLQVDYGFDLGPGQLSTQLYLNYLLSWKQQAGPLFPSQDFAGTVAFFGAGDGLGGSYPEIKANLLLRYSLAKFDFDVRARFIDAMENRAAVLYPGENSFTGTSSVTYVDVAANWRITDSISVRAGLNNALDKDPPQYQPNVQSGTEPSLFDVIGRRWFAQVKMKF
ncbi:MAG: TonB-dependent receptor [Steroidobacteraceae bacterium]|nr:TonB-dependent receptor [Nevskiaceae bacterium]